MGPRGEGVTRVQALHDLHAVVVGFGRWLKRPSLIRRAGFGLLARNIENVVVETKQLGVEVEVWLDRIVKFTASIVGPWSVGIFHVGNMRSVHTLVWRAVVCVGGKVTFEIASFLSRYAYFARWASPCPVARHRLGGCEGRVDDTRRANHDLSQGRRCWRSI